MGNFMFKISNLLIAGLNMSVPENSTIWGGLGSWFVNLGTWIWEIICRFIYVLVKFTLNIVDFLQYFVQSLVGVNAWRSGGVTLDNIGESDLIFKFIFHETIQKIFKYMIGVFFVLLIVFTIIAIVKTEYNYAVSTDSKTTNAKGKVLKSSLKAIFLVFIIPLFIVLGVLSSNAILASILNAISGGDTVTMGGQIFTASAYEANKYRVYANSGIRIPVTNNVSGSFERTISDPISGEYTETYFVDHASTSLTPVVPCNFGRKDKFTGYMFSLSFEGGESKDFLYYVDENASDGEKQNVYNYIIGLLGGTIKKPYDTDYENWGTDNQGIKINLHEYKKSSSVNQAAYNTWNYNEILTRTSSFDKTLSKREAVAGERKYEVGGSEIYLDESVIYTNANSWAKLHDGGENGLVALPQEYLANADMIDYMIMYNVEFSVVNIHNDKLQWTQATYANDTEGDKGLKAIGSAPVGITNNLIDTVNKKFVVKYSNGENVLYRPSTANTEEAGGIFIYAYKNPKEIDENGNVTQYEFIPVLNNAEIPVNKICSKKENGEWEYWLEAAEYKLPSCESLNATYNGLIVARGILESTYSDIPGCPTQIVETINSNETHDLTYERAVVKGGKWHIDFCFNVLNLFDSDGATWRCKLSLGESYGESETEKAHFSSNDGVMRLDYNFVSSENPGIQFSTFFIAGKMNIIILMFSTILVMIVLGEAVWGLIQRVYDIALYFVVMPGIVAATPLEYTKNMYSEWQSGLIKKVFGAYGVLIGLNIYFVLLGPMREASQIFSEGDIQRALNEGNFFSILSAGALNNIIYLLFSLVAITLIQTLPKTIATMLKFDDVHSSGKEVKKAVGSTVKEVGNTVSGKKAVDAFNNIFKPEKPGEGLRGFIPGSAIYDTIKNKQAEKNKTAGEKKAEEAANNLMRGADAAYNAAEEDEKITDAVKDVTDAVKDDSKESKVEDTGIVETKTKTEVESATITEKPEISDAALESLKQEIIAKLEAMQQDLEAKNADLLAAIESPDTSDTDKAKLQQQREEVQAKISSVVKSKEQVKSENFDASGLDNASVKQYEGSGNLAEAMQRKNRKYSTDASKYGEQLSPEVSAKLAGLEKDKKEIKSRREQTDALATELSGGKTMNDSQRKALFESKGLKYDEALRIAYTDGDKVPTEFKGKGVATKKEREHLVSMGEREKEVAKLAASQQDKIAGSLADKMVDKNTPKAQKSQPAAPQAERAPTATTPEVSNMVRATKGYADAARGYAEASRTYSNIATGKAGEEKKNITQKILDRLEHKKEKRDAAQEQGKARTFMLSGRNRDKAYEEFNKDKGLKDSIINKSSKAVEAEAIKRYNESQEALEKKHTRKFIDKDKDRAKYDDAAKKYFEKKHAGEVFDKAKAEREFDEYQKTTKIKSSKILDKDADRAGYLAAAEEYFKETFKGEEFDIHKAEKEFDKYQKELKENAVETHFESIKEDAAIEHWNRTHKPEEQIKDAADMRARKLENKVTREFDQEQENRRMVARNNFINDRLDNRIVKQREKVAMRGESGFVGYMAKRLVKGTGKALTHKTTQKDIDKIKEKLKVKDKLAEEKRANIKYLEDKLKAATSAKDRKELQKAKEVEERSLAKLNESRTRLNIALGGERQGALNSFARRLGSGKRAVKANMNKIAEKFAGRRVEKSEKKQEKAESKVKGTERTFNLGKDKDGNPITRSGKYNDEQAKQLSMKAQFIRRKQKELSDLRKKLDSTTDVKEKESIQARIKIKEQSVAWSEKDFNKLMKQYDKNNGTSYLNRKEEKLSQWKRDQLKLQKKQLFREMESAAIRGDNTEGYIRAIEQRDKDIAKLGTVPPRFKGVRNFANGSIVRAKQAANWSVMTAKKVGSKARESIERFKDSDFAYVAKRVAPIVFAPVYVPAKLATLTAKATAKHVIKPTAKFVKKAAKGTARVAGTVAYATGKVTGVNKLVRVHKAKAYLANEGELNATQKRHIDTQTKAQARRSVATEVTKAMSQEQYIKRVTNALIKYGRSDLTKGISDSDSARSIINSQIKDMRKQNEKAIEAVKKAQTGEERTAASIRQKEIAKTLRMLETAARGSVAQGSAARSVDTSNVDSARRRAGSSRTRSAQSTADSRTSGAGRKGSGSESKKDKQEKAPSTTEKVNKTGSQLSRDELKREIEKEIRKREKERTSVAEQVSDARRKGDTAKVKVLEKKLKEVERKLKTERNKYSKIVPKIEIQPNSNPEGK